MVKKQVLHILVGWGIQLMAAKKILSDPAELKNISTQPKTVTEEAVVANPTASESRDIKKDLEELKRFLVDLRTKI